ELEEVLGDEHAEVGDAVVRGDLGDVRREAQQPVVRGGDHAVVVGGQHVVDDRGRALAEPCTGEDRRVEGRLLEGGKDAVDERGGGGGIRPAAEYPGQVGAGDPSCPHPGDELEHGVGQPQALARVAAGEDAEAVLPGRRRVGLQRDKYVEQVVGGDAERGGDAAGTVQEPDLGEPDVAVVERARLLVVVV